jgi:hypothetical protein
MPRTQHRRKRYQAPQPRQNEREQQEKLVDLKRFHPAVFLVD